MSTLTSTTASSNFKTLTTIGFYSAFIGLGVTSAALGPTLPGLAQNTHSSLDAISSLFIGRSSGYLLGSLIGGSFYDRLPGSRLMAAMLTLMAVMLFFVPLASTLWLLVLIMGLLGVGEGALDTGGNTLLSRVHAGNLGPFMNGLHFFFGVGTSITPIIIAMTFLSSGSLNWAYWTLSLLLIPIIIWLFFQPNPPVQMQAHQVTGTTGISSRLLAWLVAALLFLYVGAEVGYGNWIYTYAVNLDLFNPTRAAYLTSIFWGAFTVGRLLAIPIAARVKAQTILLVDVLGSLACLAAILLSPSSPNVLWVATAGTGLFFASFFPTAVVLAGQKMALTGRTMGYFLVSASLGGMSVPWLIGQLFEPVSPKMTMVVILAAMLVCLLVFLRLAAYNRPQTT